MNPLNILKIWFDIFIVNIYFTKLHSVDMIAKVLANPLMFSSPVQFNFLKDNPLNNHFFDKYLPVLLITPKDFLNLTWLIAPFAVRLFCHMAEETSKHIFWECL